jgi:transposase
LSPGHGRGYLGPSSQCYYESFFKQRVDALRAEGRYRVFADLELGLRQISEVETERDEMLQLAQPSSPAALLMRLKGIGAEFATVLYLEGLFRRFDNRRQLAAYAGLTPSPWKSGSIDQNRVSRRPVIRVCAPQWSSLLGCG